MAESADITVLNCVYRNAKTGEQAITDLMPVAGDSRFISDLTTQRGEYTAIGKEAATRLVELGSQPQPVGAVKRAGMKMGVIMNTMTNDDTEHLAELMIKGSNMGIIDMTKTLNANGGAAPETLGLAQKLVNTEHDNIVRLKSYLGTSESDSRS